MSKCEWCGKEFDEDEAREQFESEYSRLSYDNIRKCLCGDCAIDAIEDEVDGVYYERCEHCGEEFDYIEDCNTFSSRFSGTELDDYWDDGPLCADCAIDVAEEEFDEPED